MPRLWLLCVAVVLLPALPACKKPASAPAPTQPAPTAPTPPSAREPVVARIGTLKESGGRLDWSLNNIVTFDQLGADNYFDVFTMNPDGSNERCLTCDRPELPNRHMGNPAWHPGSGYIVFQAQKATAPPNALSDFFANPGAGVNNDLWIMNSAATRFWRLTDVPLLNGGVLHPHFSRQGDRLLWSERLSAVGGPSGTWALKVADFRIVGDTPRLENVRTYQPGAQRQFYESHGFTADGRRILFSGNLEAGQASLDIYIMDLQTEQVTNLTSSPGDWDEHAQLSPGGGWIAWMSSMGPGGNPSLPRSDFWLMRTDGSSKRQITFMNQAGRPEFVQGGATAADSSWNPDGTRLLGYVIVEFGTGRARMVNIEFSGGVDALEAPGALTPDVSPGDDRSATGPEPDRGDSAPARDTGAQAAVRIAVTGDSPGLLRDWDDSIERMIRDRQLQLVASTADPFSGDRQHERFAQIYDGVPVHGGELVRQRSGTTTISVFGTLFPDIRVDTTPTLGSWAIRERLSRQVASQIVSTNAEMEGPLIVPGEGNSAAALAYRVRVVTADNILACFIDAHSGALLTTCGEGQLTGFTRLNVRLAERAGEHSSAAEAAVYDMRRNTGATLEVLSPTGSLEWLDAFRSQGGGPDPVAANTESHTRTTLKYLQQRFGRDPFAAQHPPISLVHPDEPGTTGRLPLFSKGPFYAGRGVLVVPEAASLGSVAHAIGHALVDATSRLIYRNESGALHEALAQLVAEGTASFAATSAQSRRTSHTAPPGADPSSLEATAQSVLGVVNRVLREGQVSGSAPRDEVERAFFRAFALMLPADSNLHQARVATLQSVRDLYNSHSALEARIDEAWASIGIR